MSNNLSRHTLGLTELQSGQGVPYHQSDKGSFYIDVLTSNFYKNIDGSTSWQILVTTGSTDNYVTGGIFTGTTLTLYQQNGSVQVTGFTSENTYVTGFTYNDQNKITLSQNNGESDLFVYLNQFSGLTVNGDLTVTGLTQTKGITSTGGITFKQVTVSNTYTATTEDYMIDASGGTFTIYLPSAVGIQGRLINVKNNGGGAVTVQPILSQTIDNKLFVILGETNSLQLVSNGLDWVALGYNISTVNSSTGVFEFSGLTIASSNTFNVSPIKGWVVDDTTDPLSPQLYYISYSGGTHTDTYVNTSVSTWVYLTSSGVISQLDRPLTEQERRQNIFLGKLSHPSKTSIVNAFSQPDYVLSPLSQLRDMFTPINLINGGIRVSANGTNLNINTSSGYLYGLGINFSNSTLNPNAISVSGTSPCTFQYRTQTGGTTTNVTSIDPLNYDNGGIVTPLTGTKATNQRIYLLQNGDVRVQYGQVPYSTLALAVAGIVTEQFIEFSNHTTNGILIGILSVLSTTTDLSNTTKALFFNVSKFGDSSGAAGGTPTTTLQQAYNNSVNPEIVTNSTLNGVQFKGGTGNDNDKNIIIETNAGVQTAWITASGDSKFNSVSATTFYGNGQYLTGIPNVTGFSYNNQNKLTISQDDGKEDLSIYLNQFSGLTVNGNVSINGSSLPNGYALSVTGDTNFIGDVYVQGDLTYQGNLLVTGGTTIQNGLTANTIYTDYIDFNTNYTGGTSQGRINWDSGTGTLNIGVGDIGGTLLDLQVGQEEIVRVYNSEATTLLKGEIVYVSGSQGNRPSVKRAIATSDGYSVTTLGMVSADVNSGSEGYVTTFGIISNLNTLGLTGGTPIFLSPITSGGYTPIKPQAPYHVVLIGYVVRISATVGSIFVNINNGWELDELHDVRISGVTTGDLLMRSTYNGSNVWVNTKNLIGNYTVSGGLTVTGTTNVNENLIVSGDYISGNTQYISNIKITNNVSGNTNTTLSDNIIISSTLFLIQNT